MNYEQNVCPYDVGQLLTAHEVIDNAIMNEVVRQVRIKRLEDYTTLELEQELELRKSK